MMTKPGIEQTLTVFSTWSVHANGVTGHPVKLTQKERGHLLSYSNQMGAKANDVLAFAIDQWEDFCSLVEEDKAVSSTPTDPDAMFFCMYADIAETMFDAAQASSHKPPASPGQAQSISPSSELSAQPDTKLPPMPENKAADTGTGNEPGEGKVPLSVPKTKLSTLGVEATHTSVPGVEAAVSGAATSLSTAGPSGSPEPFPPLPGEKSMGSNVDQVLEQTVHTLLQIASGLVTLRGKLGSGKG